MMLVATDLLLKQLRNEKPSVHVKDRDERHWIFDDEIGL